MEITVKTYLFQYAGAQYRVEAGVVERQDPETLAWSPATGTDEQLAAIRSAARVGRLLRSAPESLK